MTEHDTRSRGNGTADGAGLRLGRWPYALVLAVSAGMYLDSVITSRGVRITLFDDSMISMAYARTLADGGGFRWFPGAPAVEGVTNPLWVGYMALLHLFRLPAAAIMVIVAATGAVAVVAASRVLCRMLWCWTGSGRGPATAVFVASALCLPVVYWSVRGMEVGLLLLLAVATVWAATSDRPAVGRRWVLAGCIAAGLVTRQDFAVTVGAVVLWQFLHARRSRTVRTDALVTVGAFVVTLALVLLWRHLEFGTLVPNTYRLKLDGFPLGERIVRGLRATLKVAPVAVLGCLGFLRIHRTAAPAGRAGALALLLVAFANLGYCIYIGGDAWEAVADRFCATPVVLFAALAVGGLHDVDWTGLVRRTTPVLAAALVTVFFAASSVVLSVEVRRSELGLRRSIVSLMVVAMVAGAAVLVRRRLGLGRKVSAVVVTLLVFWCTSGMASSLVVGRRLGDGDADRLLQYSADRTFADLGDDLRRFVDPSGTVAVTAAGAPVYFSRRAAVDILGKNDPVIAKQGSRLDEFWPGHSKWDYEWTIGVLRPDLVAQLWLHTPEELAYAESLGYECRRFTSGSMEWDMWVLATSEHLTPATRSAPACP